VALTGNVASGKSSVAEAWREAGVPVLSADELARTVVEPGSAGLAEIVRAFGPEALGNDGELDRAAMRERVFQDPEARARLEGIIHPRIQEERARWVEEERRRGSSLVVNEIPLLFEKGLEKEFDVVVLVDASEKTRLGRMVERRGLDEEEARRMMAAQTPSDRKRARADHVLPNEGTPEELEGAALALLDRLQREAP